MALLESTTTNHFPNPPYYLHKDDTQPGSPLTRSPSPQPQSHYQRHSSNIAPIADGYRSTLALLQIRERSFTVPKTPQDSTWAITRDEVVSWFIDVCAELSLSQPVVAIAANIFDRFSAISQPPRELAAAIAAGCLLIASKIAEDDIAPRIEYLARRVRIRSKHLANAEAAILSALNWRVNVVTPHEVAREMLDCLGGAEKLPTNALYELESLALAATLEHELIGVSPTTIATAAIAVALECAPRSNIHQSYHLATLRVNTFVLARDSGYDVDTVDRILPILRASMRRIIDSNIGDIDDLDDDDDVNFVYDTEK